MDKAFMDVFTNPVKCKLFLEIQKCGETTAKHLAGTFADIPPATLYRYLKRMTNDKILKIVGQTQVRGAVEKTYAIDTEITRYYQDIIDSNSGEAYMQLFMQYMMGFAKLFQSYCQQDDIDIAQDKSGFSLAPLYLTDDELEKLAGEIQNVIKPYTENRASKDRKLRSMGVIISPPAKE